jgi:hypothetical protein
VVEPKLETTLPQGPIVRYNSTTKHVEVYVGGTWVVPDLDPLPDSVQIIGGDVSKIKRSPIAKSDHDPETASLNSAELRKLNPEDHCRVWQIVDTKTTRCVDKNWLDR